MSKTFATMVVRPPGMAAMVLALLLQILTPLWAIAMPQEESPTSIELFGGLDAFPICRNANEASPASLPSPGDHSAPHRFDQSCAACQFCCQPPLPLDQAALPLPPVVGLRLAEFVQATSPRGSPAYTTWARAPPVFS